MYDYNFFHIWQKLIQAPLLDYKALSVMVHSSARRRVCMLHICMLSIISSRIRQQLSYLIWWGYTFHPLTFYPQSLHTPKKHLGGMITPKIRHFCSGCLDELHQGQKCCSKRACKHSGLSYYAVLPFEEHLGNLFAGMYIWNVWLTKMNC